MRLFCAGLVLAALAGCGTEEQGGEPASGGETELSIAVWPGGRGTGAPERYTLRCDPPAGTLPDPQAACAALETHGLEPVAGDVACTQIHGGPEEAEVVGTIEGEEVSARFDRTNGCEIARWDSLAALLN